MIELPEISIVIVSYNRLEVLCTTILGLLHHMVTPSIEIILVDNGSKERIVETIRQKFPSVRIIPNETNLGFGGGNNVGAKHASGKLLVFANSDLIVRGNPLPAMVDILKSKKRVGIVGCQLLNEDGTLQPSYFRFPNLPMRFLQLSGLKTLLLRLSPRTRLRVRNETETGFVTGAFFMVERDLFFDVGGFDERYFMYVEDADLAYQVKCKGKVSYLLETRDIVHRGKNYEDDGNPFIYYHMNVGHLLFYKKNYRQWKLVMLVMMSLLVYVIRLLSLFRTQKNHDQREVIQKLIKMYLFALRHGIHLFNVQKGEAL